MRWFVVACLAVVGLADLLVLNLVAYPRYAAERAAEASSMPRDVSGPVAVISPPTGPAPTPDLRPPPRDTAEPPAPPAPTPVEAPPVEAPPVEAPPVQTPPEAPPAPGPIAPTGRWAVPPPPNVEPALFRTRSMDLQSWVQTHLLEVVVVMRRRPQLRVLLRGHADERGDEQENLRLSQGRAEAVAAFLVDQGIARERIDVEWVGEAMPADTSGSPAARARNRRVEMVWR